MKSFNSFFSGRFIKIIGIAVVLWVWFHYYHFVVPNNTLTFILQTFSVTVSLIWALFYFKKVELWWKEILGWLFFIFGTTLVTFIMYFFTHSLLGIILQFLNSEGNIVEKKCSIQHVENTNGALDKLTYSLDGKKYGFVMDLPNTLSNQTINEFYLLISLKELPFDCYYIESAKIYENE
jgi:hypothetical protein